MNCPYCKKEMKEGFIPAIKMALQWLPKGGKLPLTIFQVAKGGVKLSKMPGWTYEKAESFYCEDCRIVITPVNNY